jgi:alpha-tubulin suppressor-like RCC1 family protein
MAINFPDSPSVNDVFTDSDSGFSYQWTGEVWKSYLDAKIGDVSKFDDISGSFDGNTTTFALTFNGTPVTPDISPETIVLSLGGVVQNPQQDFTIGGSNITFTTAPAEGLTFFATRYETGLSKDYISSNVISPSGLSTGGFSWNTSNDLYISGVATVSNTGTASTALTVLGDTRISGILTVGSSSVTIDGGTNRITGTGITLSSDGVVSSAVTATTYSGDGANLAGAGLTDGASINTTGIITATKFVGDATNLTGIGGDLDGIVFNPSIGSTTVGVTTALKITFNKAIQANAGTITLRTNAADGTIVESYDVATVGSSSTISINGSVLQVTPSSSLAGLTTHFLVVPVGTVKDVFGISTSLVIDDYSFITEETSWGGGLIFGTGGNSNGELGQNDVIPRSSPTQIPGTGWQFAAMGYYHSLLLKNDGTLFTTGYGVIGELGQNVHTTNASRSSPVQVPGTEWGLVAAAYQRSGAVKTDGTLWGWGMNTYGELGQNSIVQYSSPRQIPGTEWSYAQGGFSMGDYGGYTTFGIKTDGTLWGWGRGPYGRIGNNVGSNNYYPSSPTQIPGTEWSWIEGGQCPAALKSDGTLWAWGLNTNGAVGINDRVQRSSPTQVPGTQWDALSLAQNSVVARKTDGTLWTWGRDAVGKLGLNAQGVDVSSPTQIPGTQWTKEISMSYYHCAAVKDDDTMWVWGYNQDGVLGQNLAGAAAGARSSPTQIPGTKWKRSIENSGTYSKLFLRDE